MDDVWTAGVELSPGIRQLVTSAVWEFAAHPLTHKGHVLIIPDEQPFLNLVKHQAGERAGVRRKGIAYIAPPEVVATSGLRRVWTHLEGRNSWNCDRSQESREAAARGERSDSVCIGCPYFPRRTCGYWQQFRGKHGLALYPPYFIEHSFIVNASIIVVDAQTEPYRRGKQVKIKDIRSIVEATRFDSLSGPVAHLADQLIIGERLHGREVFSRIAKDHDLHQLLEAATAELRFIPSFLVQDFGEEEPDTDELPYSPRALTYALRRCLLEWLAGEEPQMQLSNSFLRMVFDPSVDRFENKPVILIWEPNGKHAEWWLSAIHQYCVTVSPVDCVPKSHRPYASALERIVRHSLSADGWLTRTELAAIAGCDPATISRYKQRLTEDVPLAHDDDGRMRASWLG